MQAGSKVSNFEQIHDRNTGKERAMPVGYRYVIYSGDSVEALGAMPLKDDDEARLFGVGVIRDLMENAAARSAAYTMDIIQGERAVASIAFGFGEVERGPPQGGYNLLIASTAVADEIEITTRIIANIIGTI
jgi:hypothetical protein